MSKNNADGEDDELVPKDSLVFSELDDMTDVIDLEDTHRSGNQPKTRGTRKGILKNNGNNTNLSRAKERPAANLPPMTNLEIDSWSILSTDTSGADYRRMLFAIGKKKVPEKGMMLFKRKDSEVAPIPPLANRPNDEELDEPLGPSDPDSFFYEQSRPRSVKLLSAISKKFTMKRSKSKRKGTSRSSEGRSRKSRKKSAFHTLTRFFKRSRSMKESMTDSDPPVLSNPAETLKKRLEQRERNKSKKKSEAKESFQSVEFHDEVNKKGNFKKPKYIPPDMTWDPHFKNGKGGLVNKPLEKTPRGKLWDFSANGGKGGYVNEIPRHLMTPPGKVWSLTAFNGQGGLVNEKPARLPAGKKWDFDANSGMGGAVDMSSDEIEDQRIRQERKMKQKSGKILEMTTRAAEEEAAGAEPGNGNERENVNEENQRVNGNVAENQPNATHAGVGEILREQEIASRELELSIREKDIERKMVILKEMEKKLKLREQLVAEREERLRETDLSLPEPEFDEPESAYQANEDGRTSMKPAKKDSLEIAFSKSMRSNKSKSRSPETQSKKLRVRKTGYSPSRGKMKRLTDLDISAGRVKRMSRKFERMSAQAVDVFDDTESEEQEVNVSDEAYV